MTDSVLLIDADAAALRSVGTHFEQLGYDVMRELSAEAALGTWDWVRPEVVILSQGLAGGPSLDVIAQFQQHGAAVILVTNGDAALGLQALQVGAEYVVPASAENTLLAAVTARVAAKVRLRRLLETMLAETKSEHAAAFLGSSPAMREVASQVSLLAQSDRTTVLITGESGTGKSWLARLIHDRSNRSRLPFFRVRCSTAPGINLDPVLFGQERGATPDATERRKGMFELADGGTLFLRDVSDLPRELQPKLLKALETRSFRRLGGSRDFTCDTRLVAATERSLAEEVEAERFREDLFYRLNVVQVTLPAVKDRSWEDRQTLISTIHESLLLDFPSGPSVVSPEAIERLLAHGWPGNVQEIRNVLQRCLLLARGQPIIGVEHLPGEFRARPGLGDRRHTPMSLDDLERQHIDRTLRYHGGNRTRAARELGISRATLINKIKLYSITD